MSGEITAPASAPCGSCPYRQDVPPGVWSRDEYEKLPPFDAETAEQPASVFMCHQQDGRMCAGWAGCHDMHESLGLRLALAMGLMTEETYDATLDYASTVPLFPTGQRAAEHGLSGVDDPPAAAVRTIGKLSRRLGVVERRSGVAAGPALDHPRDAA